MNLQTGATAMGRRQAELRMLDSCEISRVGASTLNEATGKMDDVATVVYAGPCRLRYVSPRVFEVEAADQMRAVERSTLSIPMSGGADVRVNDIATITAVDPDVGDPALVGVKLRISGVHSESGSTARRFPVEVTL